MYKSSLNTTETIFILSILIIQVQTVTAQTSLQDSTLNNLIHPAGYITSKPGELGGVKMSGSGKQSMILIPGLGFSAEVFDDFAKAHESNYTMYAITPAGFGGTPAPSMPDTSVKYSELTWTNGIVTGILNLIEKEHLNKPIIVAHFVTATQVALNLALNYPEKLGKVIIMSGSPYRYYASRKNATTFDWDVENILTPQKRGELVQAFWAPKWFKTVTKKTWDDNMWTPTDYCQDSVTGKHLYKTSADVPLQVMIRYLIEWMADDPSKRYKDITVPTLILIPDFSGISLTPDSSITAPTVNNSKQYLKYFHQYPWKYAKESRNELLQVHTVPNTRLFMWYDNPTAAYSLIKDFIKK